MRELFEKLKKHLEQGEAAVLVTVIASSGSTPRGAGSRMLVDKDGLVCGTIGGGAVEYKAMGIAKEALEKKSSYTHGFTLTRNQVADIGMVCGGDVTVYFQYVDPEDRTFRAFLEQILEALSRDEDSWLLLDITDETCWKMGLYRRGETLGMDLPEEMDKSFGVKALQREKREKSKPQGGDLSLYLGELEKTLSGQLGRKVKISHKGKKGRIELEYYDTQDLEDLLTLLQHLPGREGGQLG